MKMPALTGRGKYFGKYTAAFTVIELLVVVAISAMLSTLAILYSSIGRNQISLTVEESKIAQFILQAKALSIATYTNSSDVCGYGVRIDVADQTYSIFAYSPVGSPPCPSVAGITGISSSDEAPAAQGTWQVPVSSGVQLTSDIDSLAAVMFYPPDPDVFLSEDNATFDAPAKTLHIYLRTVDGKNSATISVNPEGQVSF
jgi:type II secretory pathway pseudopilin PulG